MSLISVIQPPLTNNAAYAGLNGKGAQLSWKSLLSDKSRVRARYLNSSDVLIEDSDLDYLLDYMTTTTYTSKTSSGMSLEFDNVGSVVIPLEINHVAFGGLNFQSADITKITAYIDVDGSGFAVSKEIDTSSRVSFYDGKPFMFMFDAIYNAQKLRVVIETGEAQVENVLLSVIYSGRTMEFPRKPAIGYQKGSWNTEDEHRFSRRQNNAFGASTIKRQGTEEKVTIPFVPTEFMDTEWKDFVRTYEYVPVFFSWSLDDFPLDTIHGNIVIDNASYVSSLYSQLSFTVKGVI